MAKERIRATTTVRRNGRNNSDLRALVPHVVREKLGAQNGDELIFEEGNMHSVERAMTSPGGYFVVTRKSAPKPPPAPAPAEEHSAPLEPFADYVRNRKLQR